MKQVKAVVPIFLILLILSFIILFFFQNSVSQGLQTVTLPLQQWTFMSIIRPSSDNTSQQQLQDENNHLRTQLAQMQELEKDNQALHDQFATTSPTPQKLLPADVIGIQGSSLFIDKGSLDNLHNGGVVIYMNNVIGRITKVTPHISQVTLLNDPSTSFTAQTAKTSANGIVNAIDGGTIIFGNVILSDKLEKNDLVMTKGDEDLQGNGYPPQLIVGKIVSVDKQASSLFQEAKIESLVDISQLRIVFVISK
jgi:rod shape-determining protein MreC